VLIDKSWTADDTHAHVALLAGELLGLPLHGVTSAPRE
jgi:hypothetical protein